MSGWRCTEWPGVSTTITPWVRVRADAIAAALHRGRDHAAALGVDLQAVEHAADTMFNDDQLFKINENGYWFESSWGLSLRIWGLQSP